MRRAHVGLITALLLVAGGLAGVGTWGARMRGGECSLYTPPGWLLASVIGAGVLILVVACVGSLAVDDTPRLQRLYVLLGLVEAAGAVGIVLYLVTKSADAYSCG